MVVANDDELLPKGNDGKEPLPVVLPCAASSSTR